MPKSKCFHDESRTKFSVLVEQKIHSNSRLSLAQVKSCQVRELALLTIEINSYYLLVSSADNLLKQFGHKSGQTECLAWSWSKLFEPLWSLQKKFLKTLFCKKPADGNFVDPLMVFLSELFEKHEFEKNQQTTILLTHWWWFWKNSLKSLILKKNQQTTIFWKNYPACKEFGNVCWLDKQTWVGR